MDLYLAQAIVFPLNTLYIRDYGWWDTTNWLWSKSLYTERSIGPSSILRQWLGLGPETVFESIFWYLAFRERSMVCFSYFSPPLSLEWTESPRNRVLGDEKGNTGTINSLPVHCSPLAWQAGFNSNTLYLLIIPWLMNPTRLMGKRTNSFWDPDSPCVKCSALENVGQLKILCIRSLLKKKLK